MAARSHTKSKDAALHYTLSQLSLCLTAVNVVMINSLQMEDKTHNKEKHQFLCSGVSHVSRNLKISSTVLKEFYSHLFLSFFFFLKSGHQSIANQIAKALCGNRATIVTPYTTDSIKTDDSPKTTSFACTTWRWDWEECLHAVASVLNGTFLLKHRGSMLVTNSNWHDHVSEVITQREWWEYKKRRLHLKKWCTFFAV